MSYFLWFFYLPGKLLATLFLLPHLYIFKSLNARDMVEFLEDELKSLWETGE